MQTNSKCVKDKLHHRQDHTMFLIHYDIYIQIVFPKLIKEMSLRMKHKRYFINKRFFSKRLHLVKFNYF
jgi:hypothetical protein